MENLDSLLIVVAIVFIIFLIIRELVCWYFKINKMIAIQQAMLETILKLYEKKGGDVNWDAVKDVLGK